MFENETLKNHLEQSSTIKAQSLVIGEWNLNTASNFAKIGNYRYRPYTVEGTPFGAIATTYDPDDVAGNYTGATDSDVVLDAGVDDANEPYFLLKKSQKTKLLFSLEDCLNRFRPRSGINKMVNLTGRYLTMVDQDIAERPRYYPAAKDDKFKYWTSIRSDYDGVPTKKYNDGLRGISRMFKDNSNGIHYVIDDTAPFVVYREALYANRIIIKTQTHVADVDLDPITDANSISVPNPFTKANKVAPKVWRIEYLNSSNQWVNTGVDLTDASVPTDGYVELAYGLNPKQFVDAFIAEDLTLNPQAIVFGPTYASTSLLPETSLFGYAYLVQSNSNEKGTYYVFNGGSSTTVLDNYTAVVPEYTWFQIPDGEPTRSTPFVTDLSKTTTNWFMDGAKKVYREFSEIKGIRIVVLEMNRDNTSFDLIEMSPRLAVNFTDRTTAFSIKKSASDIGVSGMPVGKLIPSNGSLTMFDELQSFNVNNTQSIINGPSANNLQVKFYEIVSEVDTDGVIMDYHVPIKTMYADGFPDVNSRDREVTINLRDQFFYFESMTAPQLFIPNVSFSFAVAMLMDSIGFSNYSFKRIVGQNDPMIPYFYIAPDTAVSEVLQELAISTQTAMFFDEFNNLIFMTKEYMMPTEDALEDGGRPVDLTLHGSKDQANELVYTNAYDGVAQSTGQLANIIDIKQQNLDVFNSGKVLYNLKYIQKQFATIAQASNLERDRTYTYKPVLLWEVAGTESTRARNGDTANSGSSFSLMAVPLASSLDGASIPSDSPLWDLLGLGAKPPTTVIYATYQLPYVESSEVKNNTIDLGEALLLSDSKYNGYLNANGEIIRFDAVEFSVSGFGNVWISNNGDYEYYFSKLPFNGKMYMTGRIRIYSEPFYDENGLPKDGKVEKHGRGQFGTTVTTHAAGVSSEWTDMTNRVGINTAMKYLFDEKLEVPPTYNEEVKSDNDLAAKVDVSGKITNWLALPQGLEKTNKSLQMYTPSSLQTSSLVMTGPGDATVNFMTYVYKVLDKENYNLFGTRMRIIGRSENVGGLNDRSVQTPFGASTFYIFDDADADSTKQVTISASSGGLGIFLDPGTNNGYFLEVAALTTATVKDGQKYNDLFFYKVKKDGTPGKEGEKAGVAVPLWRGLRGIIPDTGFNVTESRRYAQDNPTVYDFAVGYEVLPTKNANGVNAIRFTIYQNDVAIAVIDDTQPLPIKQNAGLFIRGNSKVMFENFYALGQTDPSGKVVQAATQAVNKTSKHAGDFRSATVNKLIQSTYLSSIGMEDKPNFSFYMEEFGTIMRECAYFNIRYDKAYPSLITKMLPGLSGMQTSTISGFSANAYGAEFLVFNNTDSLLSMDSTSSDYLKIFGITFTQQSQQELSVDEYFAKKSDFSNPEYSNINMTKYEAKSAFMDIKNSRAAYGNKEFTLGGMYLQDRDEAENIMGWIIQKTMKPRKSVGLDVFGMPILQLGDIVRIDYQDEDGINSIASDSSRFIVYSIEYNWGNNGPTTSVYVTEVV